MVRVRAYRRLDGSWRPPSGPGRSTLWPSLSPGPSECRLWANRARIDYILLKVSQNRIVSPEFVEKACHSPYSQNGSGKSALDFLGFPYSTAFSHKELMGHFRPYTHVYCQNDEVSPECTPSLYAKWSSDTPSATSAS